MSWLTDTAKSKPNNRNRAVIATARLRRGIMEILAIMVHHYKLLEALNNLFQEDVNRVRMHATANQQDYTAAMWDLIYSMHHMTDKIGMTLSAHYASIEHAQREVSNEDTTVIDGHIDEMMDDYSLFVENNFVSDHDRATTVMDSTTYKIQELGKIVRDIDKRLES